MCDVGPSSYWGTSLLCANTLSRLAVSVFSVLATQQNVEILHYCFFFLWHNQSINS